jgi:hypothetical protein
VKLVYTFFGLALVAVVAFWLTPSTANQFLSEEGAIEAPEGVYDPVRAGEPTPVGYRQLLRRDAILPIYNPTFRTAPSTPWDDGLLVIGVELDGEAKAYPVSFLNRREMVMDWIAGTPILVSW